MNEAEIRKYISYMSLKDELADADTGGISLLLEGKKACPDEIAKACVFREGSDYMRDYIRDEQSGEETLSFDRVQNI